MLCVYSNIKMPHTDWFITTTQASVSACIHTQERIKLNSNTRNVCSTSQFAQLTIETWNGSLIDNSNIRKLTVLCWSFIHFKAVLSETGTGPKYEPHRFTHVYTHTNTHTQYLPEKRVATSSSVMRNVDGGNTIINEGLLKRGSKNKAMWGLKEDKNSLFNVIDKEANRVM